MPSVSEHAKRGGAVAGIVLSVAFGIWCCQSGASATPPQGTPPTAAGGATPAAAPAPANPGVAPAPGAAAAPAPVAPASAATSGTTTPVDSTTARITFTTVPAVAATVTWGKKLLGRIPARQALVVVRPRDSGPLDVVVKANGYMSVTTRAHTFADTRVAVKLTTLEQMNTLVGYRAPLDAGVTLGSDGLPIDGGGGGGATMPASSAMPATAP